jgi:hypothetical protein
MGARAKAQYALAAFYGPAEAVPLLQSWLLSVVAWLNRPGFVLES